MARSLRKVSAWRYKKMRAALKELRESSVWLRVIVRAELLPEHRLAELLDEGEQLSKIVAQSILTAKKNRGRSR